MASKRHPESPRGKPAFRSAWYSCSGQRCHGRTDRQTGEPLRAPLHPPRGRGSMPHGVKPSSAGSPAPTTSKPTAQQTVPKPSASGAQCGRPTRRVRDEGPGDADSPPSPDVTATAAAGAAQTTMLSGTSPGTATSRLRPHGRENPWPGAPRRFVRRRRTEPYCVPGAVPGAKVPVSHTRSLATWFRFYWEGVTRRESRVKHPAG